MSQAAVIQRNLEKLGLEYGVVQIYIALNTEGNSSALQLAKHTGISRTQVYRHLEDLQKNNLVNAEQLGGGTVYSALPITNVKALLDNRDAETAVIRQSLGDMSNALQALAGAAGPKAAINHCYGSAGLKQAIWNSTKAKHELCIFESAQPGPRPDRTFTRRYREQLKAHETRCRRLTNNPKISLRDLEPINLQITEIRYADPSLLALNFEAYIYDNTITLLDYSEGSQMAIELTHPTLKNVMQQLFNAMWAQAAPAEITRK